MESLTTRHRVGQADEITGDTQIKSRRTVAAWSGKGQPINTIAAHEDTIDLHMLPGVSVTRGSGS